MKIGWWSAPLLALTVFGGACTVERSVSDDDDGGRSGVSDDDDGSGRGGAFVSTVSTGSGAGSYSVADACAGIQQREAVCFEGSIDQRACEQAGACFRMVTRDEAEPKILSCYAAWRDDPACSDPHCLDQVSLDWQMAHFNHHQRCSDYANRCGVDGGDICRNDVSHLESSLVEAMAPCFDVSCGGLEACVEAVADDYTGGCDPAPL